MSGRPEHPQRRECRKGLAASHKDFDQTVMIRCKEAEMHTVAQPEATI